MRRRRRQLSSRILASVVAILLASTLVGFVLVTFSQRSELEHHYQQRALAVAQTFAATPSIAEGLSRRSPADRRLIQSLAERVRHETGATYIVVINRSGVRYSHPDPRLIGERVTEPVIALDGRDHTGVDHGNLGVSANAKVPVRGPDGSIIGEVSAGILEGRVSDQLLHELPSLLLYFACALAIGVIASLTLTRRLKRSTFGLELEEIAALVQEREAMLHGIAEGVITLDPEGRVTLINDEARRLIPLQADPVGRGVEELVSHRRLSDLLTGTVASDDPVVVTDDHILVVNRMPVFRQGRDLGAVITLRDRTELEGLLRELDSVDALTEALRAQQHEFSNRMHTVAGLIELGDHDAAVRYSLDVSSASAGRAEAIRERVEAPELAALLMAKTTVAAERGVQLELSEDSRLTETEIATNAMLSIIGNLIDNAIDAAGGGDPAKVTVCLTSCAENVRIEVSDTGSGVPKELTGPDLHRRVHHQTRRRREPPRNRPCARAPARPPRRRHDHRGQLRPHHVHRRAPDQGSSRRRGERVIATLIVEDDCHVATIHAAYVRKVRGFAVAAHASTIASARSAIRQLAPTLVLLDLYLPDGHGLDLVRETLPRQEPRPDFLVITAARDMTSVRAAMQLGTVHYLVKPFRFAQLEERLTAYRDLRGQLERLDEAEQYDVDTLYGLLRGPAPLPKGQSGPTMARIRDLVHASAHDMSAAEIADEVGR